MEKVPQIQTPTDVSCGVSPVIRTNVCAGIKKLVTAFDPTLDTVIKKILVDGLKVKELLPVGLIPLENIFTIPLF
jgi:hypothetical protein